MHTIEKKKRKMSELEERYNQQPTSARIRSLGVGGLDAQAIPLRVTLNDRKDSKLQEEEEQLDEEEGTSNPSLSTKIEDCSTDTNSSYQGKKVEIMLPKKEEEEEEGEEVDMSLPLLPYFGPNGHVRQLTQLTVPIIISEIFQNALPIVDIAFVGQLSTHDLAAAALATVWFNLWNATMLGFLTAIDTLLSQAYGAQQFQVFGMWAGNGLAIILVVTCIMGGLLALCAPCMVLFGQDPDLAYEAGQFSYRLIPGIFPLYAFKVLIKHLQTQDIVFPGVLIGMLANIFNAFFNWLFIFGLGMGLQGAPIATTLTRFVECLAVMAYFYWNRNSDALSRTWPSFDLDQLMKRRQSMSSDENPNYNPTDGESTLMSFLKIAGSGALSMTAEAWSFEVTTILAGLVGTVELDAHIITLSIATFVYLSFPFAIGIAASIKVGQWTGEGRATEAKRSSVTSYGLTAACQATLIVILLPCGQVLGDLFSSAQEVSDLAAQLIPLSCIFMMGDSIQSTNGGILRGLGRQNLVFWLNVVGFWLLAVPAGALLTFVADIGVQGLWWGMVIGIYSSALIGWLLLKYRVDWHKEACNAQNRISLAGKSMELAVIEATA